MSVTPSFPISRLLEVFEQKDLATHELGTDKPGRSYSPAGHGRSAVTQTDWHDQSEQTFLTELAQHLDAAVAAGKVKSLIMVAPPRALGMIRPAYSHALRGAVRAELDKDLVKLQRVRDREAPDRLRSSVIGIAAP